MNSNAISSGLLLDATRFESELAGKPVRLFTLRNATGMVVAITNYGARIEQILVPDREGRFDDVVLGYDSIAGVVGGSASMGAFLGRYAGRLGNARFTLAGTTHQLAANNGQHCLHGGLRGSRFRVFEASQRSACSVELTYVFADGEEGFPGTLALRLVYSLTDADELVLDYEAVAIDKPTVASFTTHAFFNLNGESSGSALRHEVTICADRYFAMTADLVATGDLQLVKDTLFDFRQPVLLASRVRGLSPLSGASLPGYDSCYLVSPCAATGDLAFCARISAPQCGRVMEVWSTEPAMQFYTGLSPREKLPGGPGKNGQAYFQQQGLCLEPQGYPNAPNCAAFPSAIYEPGQSRRGRTVYRFSTQPDR